MAVAAFVICGYLADCIIYSNDLANLLGVMIGFAAYMLVFHSGTLLEKLSAVLVFYPALIAINVIFPKNFRKISHAPIQNSNLRIKDSVWITKSAKEKQIDFNAVISFESGAFLEALDISTIFGNALDNAIEASEKLPEDQRIITVKADRVRDMLLLISLRPAARIRNSDSAYLSSFP